VEEKKEKTKSISRLNLCHNLFIFPLSFIKIGTNDVLIDMISDNTLLHYLIRVTYLP